MAKLARLGNQEERKLSQPDITNEIGGHRTIFCLIRRTDTGRYRVKFLCLCQKVYTCASYDAPSLYNFVRVCVVHRYNRISSSFNFRLPKVKRSCFYQIFQLCNPWLVVIHFQLKLKKKKKKKKMANSKVQ